MDLLTVTGIGKKENEKYLVQQVSFSQRHLQQIAIAGETGSGKSSLLKIIAGLLQPDEGAVYFEGAPVPGPFEKLIPGHPRIAYLSQHFELRNNYRVEEELESRNLLSAAEADKIYKVCRIDHLLKRKTTALSGGERQRIVLARLLTTSPRLLLLDEPFSNLDAPHKSVIKSVLTDIANTLGVSCILVSHDTADLLSWAHHILVMKQGRIIQQGTPQELYNNPVDEYCAGLFGEYNLAGDRLAGRLLKTAYTQDGSRKLFLRPEQLCITQPGADTIQGIAEKVQYFGADYLVTVFTEGEYIRIKTDDHSIKAGDSLYIKTKGSHFWYLPCTVGDR